MSPALVGYEHFLGIAARLEWDAEAIDVTPDAGSWPALDPGAQERVVAFLAAFALAEERVATDLEPFVAAAPSAALADCFCAQARDEERHSRFFARYSCEVLGPGDPRRRVEPAFAELFEGRLSEAAETLTRGHLALANAVALYHLLLEGVVLSAGQQALLAELDQAVELPGLREGVERVVADERWHIGLGVRVLRGESADSVSTTDGAREIEAWGALLSPDQRDGALRHHRRRLRAAGLDRLAAPVHAGGALGQQAA